MCTASPHDEFYFNNPHKITGDKPPQPYLALNRWEIIQRVINSELLRRAFLSLSDPIDSSGSTQGNFGQVETWRQYKQDIGNWLSNSDDVDRVFDALTKQTEFEGRYDLMSQFRDDLVSRIEDVVNDSRFIQSELSERLALQDITFVWVSNPKPKLVW